MNIEKTINLPEGASIVTGTHFGFPAARYMEGSIVRGFYFGPRAEKRAWGGYHRAESRIPTYEEGSFVEPDMNLPEALQASADSKEHKHV